MTDIDRAVDQLDDLLFKIGTDTGGSYAELIDVAADLVGAHRKETTPQIISTPEELAALDPDTLLLPDGFSSPITRHSMDIFRITVSDTYRATIVAEGPHLRACREALRGEEK